MLQQLHVLIVAENTSTKCMAFYRDYVLVVVKMSINALVYYKQMQTISISIFHASNRTKLSMIFVEDSMLPFSPKMFYLPTTCDLYSRLINLGDFTNNSYRFPQSFPTRPHVADREWILTGCCQVIHNA
jgi:hypothetical protein